MEILYKKINYWIRTFRNYFYQTDTTNIDCCIALKKNVYEFIYYTCGRDRILLLEYVLGKF